MQDENYELDRKDRPPEEDPARYEDTSFSDNLTREELDQLRRNEASDELEERLRQTLLKDESRSEQLDRLQRENIRQGLKDSSKAIGKEKRRLAIEAINEKKKFFKKSLGAETSKTAGKKSEDLYQNTEIVRHKSTGIIIGLEFKGAKVVVRGGQFSNDKKLASKVNEFKLLLKAAEREHSGSADEFIEDTTTTFDEKVNTTVKQDFVDSSRRALQDLREKIETIKPQVSNEKADENIEREFQKLKSAIEQQLATEQTLHRENQQLEKDIKAKQKSAQELREQLEEQKQTLLKKTKELQQKNANVEKTCSEKKKQRKNACRNSTLPSPR